MDPILSGVECVMVIGDKSIGHLSDSMVEMDMLEYKQLSSWIFLH